MKDPRATRTQLPQSAWPLVRLADVCDIQLGKMLSPASKQGVRSRQYLRNANVQWGRFDLGDIAEMDFTEEQEAKFRLRTGDVMVCEGGEPGRAAVWRGDIKGCLYQKSLHRLRPNLDVLDSDYLAYRLRHAAFRSEFTGSHAKTTIAHLPAVRLAELRIELPPPAEQKRIAAALRERLDAAARMRAAADRQDASMERLRRAVIESQLSAADPWPPQPIGQMSSVVSKGTTPTSLGLAYTTDGVPFVRAEDVLGVALDVAAIAVHIDESTHQMLRRSQLRAGDILITIAGTLGRAGYVPTASGQLNCNQAVAFVRPLPEVLDSRYGCHALQRTATLARLVEQAAGGALQNLNLAHVRELCLPVPPLSTQREIVAGLEGRLVSHGRAAAATCRQRLAGEQLPSALLRRAFSRGC